MSKHSPVDVLLDQRLHRTRDGHPDAAVGQRPPVLVVPLLVLHGNRLHQDLVRRQEILHRVDLTGETGEGRLKAGPRKPGRGRRGDRLRGRRRRRQRDARLALDLRSVIQKCLAGVQSGTVPNPS